MARILQLLPCFVACALLPASAAAQPRPDAKSNKPAGDKLDAKALMASGLKLFNAKDYLGALAVFKDAYARFPSAKILLNIGTTQRLLERHADAANTYQRYLDATDADPAKKAEVGKAIAELDKKIGLLELAVTPEDAEVQLDDGDWQPAAALARHRVAPGAITVRARKDAFQPETKSLSLAAGEKAAVSLALTAIPPPVAPPPVAQPSPEIDPELRVRVEPDGPRSRIGALAMLRIDAARAGGAGLIGLTVDAVPRLQVQGAAILGPFYGGYAGASFAFLTGTLRPIASAGMAIFSSDGARYALRGAGGVEVQLGRHVSLIAEVGIEYVLNEQITEELAIEKTVFIPTIGASARL